jgi:DMSO/TMAO reductase YedYZ heme-binding membrane subunit
MKSKKMKRKTAILFLGTIIVFALGYFLVGSSAQAQKNVLAERDNEINEYERNDDKGYYIDDSNVTSLPVEPIVVQQPASLPGNLIPWYISRAAGISSYVLMFLIIVMGEGMTSGFTYKFATPVNAWLSHKYLGISFGITVIVHMLSLLFDKFIGFGLGDLFVPFHSSYHQFLVSLGIFSFYILMVVILSSIFIRLQKPFLWRKIHYLVYPMFIIAFIHGLFLGTDSKLFILQMIYGVTGFVFIILILHRWKFNISRK